MLKNIAVTEPVPASSSDIISGRRIGPVQVGDTRKHAQEMFNGVFGNKHYEEYTYQYSAPCWPEVCCEGVTQMHWLDYDDKHGNIQVQNGIYVYVSKGRVIQIVAATKRYSTEDGITTSSAPDEIRRQYPGVRSFVRVGFHSEAEGGRDMVFWDDLNHGIAFEFWYDRKLRQRYLEAIIVHEPGMQLLPEGCMESSSEWQRLDPFSLDIPSTKVPEAKQ